MHIERAFVIFSGGLFCILIQRAGVVCGVGGRGAKQEESKRAWHTIANIFKGGFGNGREVFALLS